MSIKQVVKGKVVRECLGKFSSEAISDVAKSIIVEGLLKAFSQEQAEALASKPEVFGPAIDGNFCIITYFPEDCENTLRKMREMFQTKHPDQVEIISSALVQKDVDGKPRIDCGL